MFNFQHPSHKTDVSISCGRRAFHLLYWKKPVGNQYVEVIRILVQPEILVSLKISAQIERHCLCSTEKKVLTLMIQVQSTIFQKSCTKKIYV